MEEEKKKWYHIPYKAQFLSRPVPGSHRDISGQFHQSAHPYPLVNPSKNSMKGVDPK